MRRRSCLRFMGANTHYLARTRDGTVLYRRGGADLVLQGLARHVMTRKHIPDTQCYCPKLWVRDAVPCVVSELYLLRAEICVVRKFLELANSLLSPLWTIITASSDAHVLAGSTGSDWRAVIM